MTVRVRDREPVSQQPGFDPLAIPTVRVGGREPFHSSDIQDLRYSGHDAFPRLAFTTGQVPTPTRRQQCGFAIAIPFIFGRIPNPRRGNHDACSRSQSRSPAPRLRPSRDTHSARSRSRTRFIPPIFQTSAIVVTMRFRDCKAVPY